MRRDWRFYATWFLIGLGFILGFFATEPIEVSPTRSTVSDPRPAPTLQSNPAVAAPPDLVLDY
jgi:hypothetical protein